MAVTAHSITYAFDPVIVSALRIALARMPVEQNYTGTDALAQLERTNKETVDAAGFYHIPVGQFTSGLEDWFDGDDEGSVAGTNESTMAHFKRAYVRRPIRVTETDEDDTGGEEALFPIYQHKLAEARRAVRTAVNAKIVSGTSTNKAIQGIPLAAEELPGSSGAYPAYPSGMGLDGATHDFWKNKTATAVGSATLNLEDSMEEAWRDTVTVGAEPDWWLVSKNVMGFLQSTGRTFRTITISGEGKGGGMNANLGTPKVWFHGKPVVMDATLSDGFAYGINNNSLKLAVIPKREFKLGKVARLEANGQSGYVVYLYFAGQIITYQRAGLVQRHGITA